MCWFILIESGFVQFLYLGHQWKISSGYYMQSKSDSWLVPSWRRVCWFCRGRGSNAWRDGFSLALEVVPVEAELARRRGEAVLRRLHRLCPARSGSTRIPRDSALALLPAAARGCSAALLCSFAVLLRVLICGLCRVTLYPDHPFPFSVRVNFVSIFTGVKFKKKKNNSNKLNRIQEQ